MDAIPHNHDIDGKLHEACLACSYIRVKMKRLKGHKEVDKDLEAIFKKALMRFEKGKKK